MSKKPKQKSSPFDPPENAAEIPHDSGFSKTSHPDQNQVPIPGKHQPYTDAGFVHLVGSVDVGASGWMKLPLYGLVLEIRLDPDRQKGEALDTGTGLIVLSFQATTTGAGFVYHLFTNKHHELFFTCKVLLEVIEVREGFFRIDYRTVIKFEVKEQTESQVRALLKKIERGARLKSDLAPKIEESLEAYSVEWHKQKLVEEEPMALDRADNLSPTADALRLRQLEAMERHTEALNRLTDEMARQRKASDQDFSGRVVPGEEYRSDTDIAELLASMPDGMFDDVEWAD